MTDTFTQLADVLVQQFQVDPATIRPETTLETLGLDSLALMEFVFAVEDRFSVRIPEDRLDPRQAGVTLQHLAALLDAERARPELALAAEAKPA
jgi:acyl carrier protein